MRERLTENFGSTGPMETAAEERVDYRLLYVVDKSRFATWNNGRAAPWWYSVSLGDSQ